MAREIPQVVRAAAGLAATVLDEARKLPETLPGLPVRVLGVAMQQAMKAQQQYAGLVARGDELFTGLRGENEPGLATFDDEPEDTSNGFRDSAFDRAGDAFPADETLSDAEVEDLPADPAADAVTTEVDQLADQIETGQQSIEELAAKAPAVEEILEEIAIDELVDQAPTLEETAPVVAGADDAPATEDADALESALLESDSAPTESTPTDNAPTDAADGAEPTVDVATTVDVLTPDGDVEAVDALVTDEGVAAPEAVQPAIATDEGGTAVASSAPATAPIDGYDNFSVAQLRGRLRGYALSTVADLLAYEGANQAREPYLRMLRNRLEKLEERAVDSSPLAPRGA